MTDKRADLGCGMYATWDEYGHLHVGEEYGTSVDLMPLQALRLMQFIERCGQAAFQAKHGGGR